MKTEISRQTEKQRVKEPLGTMPYCDNCGAQLVEGASFCQNCGKPVGGVARPRLETADWGVRFVAWIIDIAVVGVFLWPARSFFALIGWTGLVWMPQYLRWIPFVDFGLDSIVYFLYWTSLEGIYGQSIGKMAMNLKVAGLHGERLELGAAAIESLGKAFLLPIDCLVGWILYPGKKQRLFNYISDTVTVKASR